jgi:hypothetical protein
VDPFSKKDWYDVKAPTMFTNRNVGKTLVTRTTGIKIASEGLKGRVIEASLADLNSARLRNPLAAASPAHAATRRTRTRRSARSSCASRTCRARTA